MFTRYSYKFPQKLDTGAYTSSEAEKALVLAKEWKNTKPGLKPQNALLLGACGVSTLWAKLTPHLLIYMSEFLANSDDVVFWLVITILYEQAPKFDRDHRDHKKHAAFYEASIYSAAMRAARNLTVKEHASHLALLFLCGATHSNITNTIAELSRTLHDRHVCYNLHTNNEMFRNRYYNETNNYVVFMAKCNTQQWVNQLPSPEEISTESALTPLEKEELERYRNNICNLIENHANYFKNAQKAIKKFMPTQNQFSLI